MRSVRRAFVRGVVTLLPVAVVVVPVVWLYGAVADLPVLPGVASAPLRVTVVAVVAGTLTLSVGYLMRTGVGRWLSGGVDRLMNALVGLRTVYNAAKNSADSLLVGNGRPRGPTKIDAGGDFRISALRTGNRSPAGREIVFLPGAPDVTSGFVVEVDPDRLEEADETTVSLGIRLISCGFSDGDGELRVQRAGIEDLGER
ncbi:DUF502 domain-containing protein [Halobium salinum]|uniref:DUF502 domain-containing protein n=1 Tax=Halobium salinum TaxID=1364940 RepID=A0ABD5PFL2_9EURY|nr:DUF502 domain-containing protein [Halobium salinum]